jgi:hypothetical protein
MFFEENLKFCFQTLIFHMDIFVEIHFRNQHFHQYLHHLYEHVQHWEFLFVRQHVQLQMLFVLLAFSDQ